MRIHIMKNYFKFLAILTFFNVFINHGHTLITFNNQLFIKVYAILPNQYANVDCCSCFIGQPAFLFL